MVSTLNIWFTEVKFQLEERTGLKPEDVGLDDPVVLHSYFPVSTPKEVVDDLIQKYNLTELEK